MEEQEKSKAHNYIKEFIKAFDNQKLNENNKKVIQKTGVVYTPEYLARYIVHRVFNYYLRDIKSRFNIPDEKLFQEDFYIEIFRENPTLRNDLLKEIKKIKILDPSCGSGIFLVLAADFLFKLYKLLAPSISNLQLKKDIIQNSIFGVEIEKRAYQMSKLRLMTWMVDNDECIIDIKINDGDFETVDRVEEQLEYSSNIYNLDFLLDFKPKQKFNMILGNPPYVENKKIEKDYKKKLNKNFQSAYKLYDLSILFIEKALNIIKPNGYISYLLTNKFLAADYGVKIRKMILNESTIKEIINISSLSVFINSAAYPIVIFLKNINQKVDSMMLVKIIDDLHQLYIAKKIKSQELPLSIIKKLPMHVIPIAENIDLIKNIYANFNIMSETIKDLKIIYRPFGFLDWYKNFKNVSKKKNSEEDLILIGTGNVGKYHILFNKRIKIAKKDLEIQYFRYSEDYLDIWQEFSQEKLIFREIAKNLTFVYDPGIFTNLTGLYFIRIPSYNTDDLFALLTILNSELIDKVFKTLFGSLHMSGGYLRFNGSFIKRLPLPKTYPKSLSYLGKIMQFLSQLNYDLSFTSGFNSIERDELNLYLKFFTKLSNFFVVLLYLKNLPVSQVKTLIFLLNSEEVLPNIKFKYCIPRFELEKYELINNEEFETQLVKIKDFYTKFSKKVKFERKFLNKLLKYNYLYKI